ncbi:hypothetical protein OJF2_78920 (plasmid) [Aquisphaera giovannonii]|uniref:Uncharacterized protein n=1 Tax=Aquisphaera giovannonii TaxID=406548 RepID=A0A5B9WFG2_9BACT|nr:hypothetical protein [Aquisphaera giovannonii]QEH39277.1 hypothetical protein OJF2_78920 [Aquisphaera giovannonii]
MVAQTVDAVREEPVRSDIDRGRLEDFNRGVRAKLTIDNHSLTDLHVHWTGDVDEDDKWDFLPHGHSATHDSRRVDPGNKATYELRVYRNDNGKPGAQIGDAFYIKVGGGLADLATLARSGDYLGYVLASASANILIIGLLG